MAAMTPEVLVRSARTVGAPALVRTAALSLPVATAMIRAPLAWAAATSFGVSPSRTVASASKLRPWAFSARWRAMVTRFARVSSSVP